MIGIRRVIDDGIKCGRMLLRDNVNILKRVYGENYDEWANFIDKIIKHSKYEGLVGAVEGIMDEMKLGEDEKEMLLRDIAHDIEVIWRRGIRHGVNEEFHRMGYRR